jgi:hypothetical protein
MQMLNSFIDGTSVLGLSIYCSAMTFLLGAIAWANYLDTRSETDDRP